MKRFRFSLEELMDLRQFRERDAEFRLAEKAGRVSLLERELMRIAAERSRVLKDRFSGPRSVLDFMADERYLGRLDRDRGRTEKDLARAELEREEALAAYTEARKQVKVLEKLREQEEGLWKKDRGRREVMDLDDMAQGARNRLAFAQGAAGY